MPNLDASLKRLSEYIEERILHHPRKFIEVEVHLLEQKNVIFVKIDKGSSLYYIRRYGRSSMGCYIRIGTTSRPMSEEEIEERYISTLSLPPRSMKEDISPRQDLSFGQFKGLLVSKDVHFNNDSFAINFSLLTKEGKYNYIAFLLSDQNDTSIKCVKFNSPDKSVFSKRQEFSKGCILRQMEEAYRFANGIYNVTTNIFEGGTRIDVPLFDPDALREAWYNAVCHNLWVEHIPRNLYL